MELHPEPTGRDHSVGLPPPRAELSTRPILTILSPVYRAEGTVEELVRRIQSALLPITENYEILLVEDKSPDGSWKKIRALCREDGRVKGIRLSRNFGQHLAITAGLQHCRGRHVVVLDCDLQDDPAFIPVLYAKALEGFDVVHARKRVRSHGTLKNYGSRGYYALLKFLMGGRRTRASAAVGNFSVISRKVVDAFVQLEDQHRHYLALLQWLGFPPAYVDVDHRERPVGKSSYSFRRLLLEAVNGVTTQSNRLLHFSVAIGFFFFVASMAAVAYIVVAYYVHGFSEGWASVFVLMLCSTGLILMSLGILGIYLGKIFQQVRGRPLYVVRDSLNLELDERAQQPSARVPIEIVPPTEFQDIRREIERRRSEAGSAHSHERRFEKAAGD